jgi:hypothetical protein
VVLGNGHSAEVASAQVLAADLSGVKVWLVESLAVDRHDAVSRLDRLPRLSDHALDHVPLRCPGQQVDNHDVGTLDDVNGVRPVTRRRS